MTKPDLLLCNSLVYLQVMQKVYPGEGYEYGRIVPCRCGVRLGVSRSSPRDTEPICRDCFVKATGDEGEVELAATPEQLAHMSEITGDSPDKVLEWMEAMLGPIRIIGEDS